MKRFLGIYIGTTSALERSDWKKLNEDERRKRQESGIKAWMESGEAHRGAIIDQGAPLGRTKRASLKGVTDIKNNMTGYVILEAESHEAAARMFENHPHFTIFPGDSVEIMECLPLPAQ